MSINTKITKNELIEIIDAVVLNECNEIGEYYLQEFNEDEVKELKELKEIIGAINKSDESIITEAKNSILKSGNELKSSIKDEDTTIFEFVTSKAIEIKALIEKRQKEFTQADVPSKDELDNEAELYMINSTIYKLLHSIMSDNANESEQDASFHAVMYGMRANSMSLIDIASELKKISLMVSMVDKAKKQESKKSSESKIRTKVDATGSKYKN